MIKKIVSLEFFFLPFWNSESPRRNSHPNGSEYLTKYVDQVWDSPNIMWFKDCHLDLVIIGRVTLNNILGFFLLQIFWKNGLPTNIYLDANIDQTSTFYKLDVPTLLEGHDIPHCVSISLTNSNHLNWYFINRCYKQMD